MCFVSEIESGEESTGFLGKAFGQAWHLFKERKRANSVALNAYLTYVTLPWHRIIAGNIGYHIIYYFFQLLNLVKVTLNL